MAVNLEGCFVIFFNIIQLWFEVGTYLCYELKLLRCAMSTLVNAGNLLVA